MHELAIACELIDLAQTAAQAAGAARVTVVHLRLGVLSGVEPDALQVGFGAARVGTLLHAARLQIEAVPLRVACGDCAQQSVLTAFDALHCPHCGSHRVRLLHGRELEIVSLEVEDDNTPA